MSRARWSAFVAAMVLLAGGVDARADDAARDRCVATYEEAQILRREARLLLARQALLVCSQKLCPAATVRDCAPWLAEVEREIPSIAVAVRSERGRDIPASISVDRAPVRGGSGELIELDPGPHRVRAVAPDGSGTEIELVVRVGEKHRAVTLVVGGAESGRDGAAMSLPTPRPTSAPRSLLAPIVASAAGVAGVGAAIFFGLQASADTAALRSACSPHCPASRLDPIKRELVFSDVGLGIGVAALVASAYLWLGSSKGGAASARAARSGGVSLRAGFLEF